MMVENSTAILLFLLGLLWVVTYMASLDKEMFEDGTGSETVTYEDSAEIYDAFYAKVYDTLFSTPERLSFEKASMHELAFNEFSKPETKILDAACGTSPHAKWLVEEGYDVVAYDSFYDLFTMHRGHYVRIFHPAGSCSTLVENMYFDQPNYFLRLHC